MMGVRNESLGSWSNYHISCTSELFGFLPCCETMDDVPGIYCYYSARLLCIPPFILCNTNLYNLDQYYHIKMHNGFK
jgi:hypothetical protein